MDNFENPAENPIRPSDKRRCAETDALTRKDEEIRFLREELKSMQKIVEMLSEDRRTPYSSERNASAPARAKEPAWKKPRKTAHAPTARSQPSFASDNPFKALEQEHNSDADEQSADDASRYKNVTNRRKKKKAENARNVPNNEPIAESSVTNNTAAEASESDETSRTTPASEPRSKRRDVIVLGDSMVKNLKGHLMSRKDCRVTCVSISGMNLDEATEVTRGLCARKPDVILVTCGTNSLFPKMSSETAPDPAEVCAKMRDLVATIERDFPNTEVILPKLIVRTDIEGAGSKIDEVNKLISDSNLPHVDHSNITGAHLNGSKLHLNHSGDILLAKNFVIF